ncbi:hypothetical protein CCH79_00009483 [Gambusia affinis]|uniref:Reverse transcriptase domain-containing protein n=1 Tax=Gambusia affinis TaxID=33528 RepID=A0A315VD55_GAMAF|nr:hypothetical protein CCH79_00009483 [Gambusia affinis]
MSVFVATGSLEESDGCGNAALSDGSLYDRCQSLVRIAGSKSGSFPNLWTSQGVEGIRFGGLRIASLLFADDVVLLASSGRDLQLSLERFAAECEAAGMAISASKSEAMVLSRKRVECLLRVRGGVLPQVEEFKYLDRWIGAASAVKRALYRSVVVKRELSQKAKLSIYRSIYVPTLIYGHELWIMTERTRSRIQAAEMGFLRRVAGLSLRDRVRSSVIREGLRVEPLLLHVERGQLRWLGHLVRMPPGRLPGEVFRARPTGRRPRGRPRTRWRDDVSRLAWERLGIPPEELVEVASEAATPATRPRISGRRWMDGFIKTRNWCLHTKHVLHVKNPSNASNSMRTHFEVRCLTFFSRPASDESKSLLADVERRLLGIRHVVGSTLKSQKENPEMSIRHTDPALKEVKQRLERLTQTPEPDQAQNSDGGQEVDHSEYGTALNGPVQTRGSFCGFRCPLYGSRLTGNGEGEGGRHAANVVGSGNRTRDGHELLADLGWASRGRGRGEAEDGGSALTDGSGGDHCDDEDGCGASGEESDGYQFFFVTNEILGQRNH